VTRELCESQHVHPNAAGDAPPDQPGTSAQLTAERFIELARSGGMAEVELSRIAKDRSGNEAVRKFADRMISDHTSAHAELQSLVSPRTPPPATTLTDAQRTAIESLRTERDVAVLDRAYATQMVKDHQETVNLFEKAASQADMDPNIRDYARRTLPTLKTHLEEAKALSTEFGSVEEQQHSR
jgi:putative membrane protein